MGYFSDLDIDRQEQEARTGDYSHNYEPDYTNTKVKPKTSLEDTMAFAKDYMKSDKFAKEWDNFVRDGFF